MSWPHQPALLKVRCACAVRHETGAVPVTPQVLESVRDCGFNTRCRHMSRAVCAPFAEVAGAATQAILRPSPFQTASHTACASCITTESLRMTASSRISKRRSRPCAAVGPEVQLVGPDVNVTDCGKGGSPCWFGRLRSALLGAANELAMAPSALRLMRRRDSQAWLTS